MAFAPPISHTDSIGGQDRVFAKGYFDGLDNGTAVVTTAELAAIRDRMAGSGTFTPVLTVYVNNDAGNDANNGLSAAAPFKTIAGMFAVLADKYPGIIGQLNINLRGTTPIVGNLTFPNSNSRMVVNVAVITGEGQYVTTNQAPTNGLYTGDFTRMVTASNFTIDIVGTGDCFRAEYQKSLYFNNMTFKRRTEGRGSWISQGSWVRLQGDIRFEGPYSYVLYAAWDSQIYVVSSLAFVNGSATQVLQVAYGGNITIYASPLAPAYIDFTLARFANVFYGGKVILPKGATLENWANGASSIVDSISSIDIPA